MTENSEFIPLTEEQKKQFRQLMSDHDDPPKPAVACTMRFLSPQEDITAYEVITIVGGIGAKAWGAMHRGIIFDDDVWEALPEGVKRHWTT